MVAKLKAGLDVRVRSGKRPETALPVFETGGLPTARGHNNLLLGVLLLLGIAPLFFHE